MIVFLSRRYRFSWWRHQMETFPALLPICAGNSPVTDEFPAQWPVTRSFDVFFDLRLNKRLSKQLRGRRFETPSCPLWRHCNDTGFCRFYQDGKVSHLIDDIKYTPSMSGICTNSNVYFVFHHQVHMIVVKVGEGLPNFIHFMSCIFFINLCIKHLPFWLV